MRQRFRTISLAVALLCIAPLAWAAAAPEQPVDAAPEAAPEVLAEPAGAEAAPAELDLGLPEPVPTCPTCNEICNDAYDECMQNCTLNPFQCELQCGEEWQNCMATC